MTTDRPGWIKRVRAIIVGDTDEGGLYRIDTGSNRQPDARDRATAAALIRQNAKVTQFPTPIDQATAAAIIAHTRAPGGTMPEQDDATRYPGETSPPPILPRAYPAPDGTLADRTPLLRNAPGGFTPVTDDLLDAEPDPLADSGIHHVPDPDPATVRVNCHHCGGTGHAMRTVSELLRESIDLIPADGGQSVIREFYRRLLSAAPDLAPLFPRDLITAATDDLSSPGRMQRDKLLQALAALADLYGTTPDALTRLNTALKAYGRSHAAFARPDGTTRGATVEEYMAVKQSLVDTLHTVTGNRWLPEYDDAWSEAYDYAMVVMLYEQFTSGMTMARYPRPNLP